MRVLSLSWIMDKAVDIHRKNLLSVTLFQLVFSIISLVVVIGSILIGGIVISIGSIAFINAQSSPLKTAGIIFAVVASVILIIFISSIVIMSGAGIMETARNGIVERRTMTGEALSFSFRNFLRIISVTAAFILLFLPVIGLWGGIMWGIYYFFSRNPLLYTIRYNLAQNSVPVIIAAVLLLTMVLTSIIWFFNIHIFSFHTAVFQRESFFKALSESRRLCRNNFWKVLAYNTLFTLSVTAIYYSIDSFVLVIGALIGLALDFFGINQDMLFYLQTVWVMISWPLRIFEQLFIAPLYGLFISLLYFNLRFKKDGYDLELKLEELRPLNLEGKVHGGN